MRTQNLLGGMMILSNVFFELKKKKACQQTKHARWITRKSFIIAKKELDKAIAVYDEALEINPNFAQAYHERGRVKLAKGDKNGSMEDMKRAIELAPENGASIDGEYNNYEQQKNIPFW